MTGVVHKCARCGKEGAVPAGGLMWDHELRDGALITPVQPVCVPRCFPDIDGEKSVKTPPRLVQ